MDNKNFKFLFKLFFLGMITATFFFSLIFAVLHPFGLSTLTLNGEQVTGFTAIYVPFIFSFLLSLFASLLFSFFAWLSYKIFYFFKKQPV